MEEYPTPEDLVEKALNEEKNAAHAAKNMHDGSQGTKEVEDGENKSHSQNKAHETKVSIKDSSKMEETLNLLLMVRLSRET